METVCEEVLSDYHLQDNLIRGKDVQKLHGQIAEYGIRILYKAFIEKFK
jgi:hypothetical protein